MTTQEIVLVDENDAVLGYKEKLQAHIDGDLHRAFSVLIMNDKGEMLIQKRATDKYHSGGLWSNACCSHPMPDEAVLKAGERRLEEELKFSCKLKYLYKFIYKADFINGLTEHELDHVLVGCFNQDVSPNPEEAEAVKWVRKTELLEDIQEHPNEFTFWFKIIVDKIKDEEWRNLF